MRKNRSMTVLAGAAIAVMLTGCTGQGAGAGGEDLTEADMPLAQYFAAARGTDLSPEEQQKRAEESQRQIDELVVACMAQAGFEYQPWQPSPPVATSGEFAWEPDDKKWVERYGYGIVNNPLTDEATENPNYDPNQAYVDALSKPEWVAFYDALNGPLPGGMDGEEYVEPDWTKKGCLGAATHEVNGDDPWTNRTYADLLEKMQSLTADLEEHPDIVALDARWMMCMEESGESRFSRPADASAWVEEEVGRIFGLALASVTPDPVTKVSKVDPYAHPEMKVLGEREVELATQDLACRTKTSYRDATHKVQFALEEAFIAANKVELEEFKTVAEQAQAG